ncbi:hypothetical protein BDA99DRAFT_558749 [Phascolomyces articulosus]|uniref:C2H2-type domain-containing protein n=1 Tax=Phascolomyces articulosus TaxID=60185 RepID=A0AAD5KCL7_9FUNG|nr:hypothetical protein BDA99DRAFT_558749 [Phascolomyces articulosus]
MQDSWNSGPQQNDTQPVLPEVQPNNHDPVQQQYSASIPSRLRHYNSYCNNQNMTRNRYNAGEQASSLPPNAITAQGLRTQNSGSFLHHDLQAAIYDTSSFGVFPQQQQFQNGFPTHHRQQHPHPQQQQQQQRSQFFNPQNPQFGNNVNINQTITNNIYSNNFPHQSSASAPPQIMPPTQPYTSRLAAQQQTATFRSYTQPPQQEITSLDFVGEDNNVIPKNNSTAITPSNFFSQHIHQFDELSPSSTTNSTYPYPGSAGATAHSGVVDRNGVSPYLPDNNHRRSSSADESFDNMDISNEDNKNSLNIIQYSHPHLDRHSQQQQVQNLQQQQRIQQPQQQLRSQQVIAASMDLNSIYNNNNSGDDIFLMDGYIEQENTSNQQWQPNTRTTVNTNQQSSSSMLSSKVLDLNYQKNNTTSQRVPKENTTSLLQHPAVDSSSNDIATLNQNDNDNDNEDDNDNENENNNSTSKTACTRCDKTFTRERDMERHRNSVHKKVDTYRCFVCHQTFTRKDSLTRHFSKQRNASSEVVGNTSREKCYDQFIERYCRISNMKSNSHDDEDDAYGDL